MNEDFLPKIYQEMYLSKTVEDYQKDFLVPVIHSRDEIQWIIDYIRSTLKEIDFDSSNSQDKKFLKKIKAYQEEQEEQLDILRICEINIKKDTNTFLNAIAGSVNYKWDDYNLTKIVGFQSDQIKCSDNLIPLPLQSLTYVLSAKYCLLLKCAINAIMLKHKVISLAENDPQKIVEVMRQFIKPLAESSQNTEKALLHHVDREMRHYENIQKQISNYQRKTRRNQITQEECAEILYTCKARYLAKREAFCRRNQIIVLPGAFKVPKLECIVRRVQRWDRAIKTNSETLRYPPKGYSREMNSLEFESWVMRLEKEKYDIWEAYQKAHFKQKRVNDGLIPAQESEDEENQEDEYMEEDRNEDLVDGLQRHRQMYRS